MSTYVVGDIQGCDEALGRLLAAVDFGPADRLVAVGDLVNRGPANLAVLRRMRAMGGESVLGNHDLHLLARLWDLAQAKPSDTLDDVLEATELDTLQAWLLHRPVLLEVGTDVVVHAGLHPRWTLEEPRQRARAVEAQLRHDPAPLLSREAPEGDRLREVWADLAIFTRIRTVDPTGQPDHSFTGSLDELPSDRRPWFRARCEPAGPGRVLFGHWSALGYHREGPYVGLDSGCVWGRSLTAFRLEDEAVFQVAAHRV